MRISASSKTHKIKASRNISTDGQTSLASELVVHNIQLWLCASPDGLILTNGRITSVIEIKCPSSYKKKPIPTGD